MANIIENIKRSISLLDYAVKEYGIDPTRSKNICPICHYDNPKKLAFSIADDCESFYCHYCNKHGDLIQLVRDAENVELKEALSIISKATGVTYSPRVEDLLKHSGNNEPDDVTRRFTAFTKKYKEKGLPPSIRAYLHKRGLTDETIEKHSIFFVPNNAKDEDKVLSGVHKIPYLFKGRIVFPYLDKWGNTYFFAARKFDG